MTITDSRASYRPPITTFTPNTGSAPLSITRLTPSDADRFVDGFHTPTPPPRMNRVPFLLHDTTMHGADVWPTPNSGAKYGDTCSPLMPPVGNDSVTGAPTA